jgi:FKBP-type peptidyl-prolyl cis-trans isomerase
MKIYRIFAIASAAVLIAACGGKAVEGTKDVQALFPSKGQIDSVSYLMGVNFGTTLKGNNFGDLNYAEMVKGIKDFMNAEGTNYQDSAFLAQFKINPMTMNEIIQAYLDRRTDYVAALNREKGEKFLAANKVKEGIDTTASGLQYKILEPGNDVHPTEVDTVWVNYKGTLIDGTVFDENENNRFTLNRVIRGWTEGIQLLGEGGKAQLFIPSDLAYGIQGNRGIEPNSTLIFDVELLKVGKFVEPEEKK